MAKWVKNYKVEIFALIRKLLLKTFHGVLHSSNSSYFKVGKYCSLSSEKVVCLKSLISLSVLTLGVSKLFAE